MKFLNYKNIILAVGIFLFFAAGRVCAANTGDVVNFDVDKGFDATGRTQLQATLVKVSDRLYFYVENTWWNSQTPGKQNQVLADLGNLSNEFDGNIYPTLTSTFGSEWSPGIDSDTKITVLFESMNSAEGGYFREADEYDKLQLPDSNQREMMYLSVFGIDDPNAKVTLGHEFTHLITFNQKNKIFGVEDDTWLNEARADYSSTILGYDNAYNGSNLQKRVNDFLQNPSDSITDWSGTKYDYASVNLFTHYLVDYYGINILSDSLKSKSVGIESINEALLKNGAKENFPQIFTDWTIALAINDCSQNSKYCYINKNLVDLRINPTLIFLPLTGNSSLSSTNVTKNWTGNWQKFIGGSGDLKLEFSSLTRLNFQVPYLIYDNNNNYSVKFLTIDSTDKGEISIPKFGTNYKSLIIMPSLQTGTSGIDDLGLVYPYSFIVSITGDGPSTDETLAQQLQNQIDSLRKQIADILAQRQGGQTNQRNSCSQITDNLGFGSSGSEVSCLQQFLKNQGTDIYPSGYVTGIFGSLTKAAAIKFQGKYGISQTGFVGILTRTKINQILSGK